MSSSHQFSYPIGKKSEIIVIFEQREKSRTCPTGIRFAVLGFIMNGEKRSQVIRIDNAPHHGIPKTHIHYIKEKEVLFRELSYAAAQDLVRNYLEEREHD